MEMLQANLGKIVFARLSKGEDVLEAINTVADNNSVTAGLFVLIGTLKNANVGFYRKGGYKEIRVKGPLEIASCTGNIALKENKPFAHGHIAVSNEKGEVMGGHVMQGCMIDATGELVIIEAKGSKLFRKLDKRTKLFLWSTYK